MDREEVEKTRKGPACKIWSMDVFRHATSIRREHAPPTFQAKMMGRFMRTFGPNANGNNKWEVEQCDQ